MRATTPTPGGGLGAHTRFFPSPKAFPEKSTGRLLHLLQLASCAGVCSRRCSVRLMLRPAWLLALLYQSDLKPKLRPTRAFTSELSRMMVTLHMSRISLHDAVGLTPRPDFHQLEYRPCRLHDFPQNALLHTSYQGLCNLAGWATVHEGTR